MPWTSKWTTTSKIRIRRRRQPPRTPLTLAGALIVTRSVGPAPAAEAAEADAGQTAATPAMAAFDPAEFRRVLGHYPTGVTVVTAVSDDGPVGLAIGSFGSVSLDPPLVMFCPGKSSNSWPVIEASGSFCVNVLAEDQAAVSSLFAGRDPDKFAGIAWGTAITGSPVIEGCLAWIDCTIETTHEAGDHWIVVGRVADLGVERTEDDPLIFFKGGYGGVRPQQG